MKQILILVCIFAFTSSCDWLGRTDSKVKPTIVFLGTLSGSYGEYGQKTLDGVRLAFQDEKKVRLEVIDTKGSAKSAVQSLQDLSKRQEVMGIIGEISSQMSLALAPAAQNLKIPMMTPTSTNPEITKVGDYIFRFCFVDQFQGFAMAKFVREELNLRNVAVLRDLESDYSRGLAEFFSDRFVKLGGKVLIDEIYQKGDRDFKDQLANIRKVNPDAIFLPGYFRESAMIIRQARAMGIKAIFLGGDGWDSKEFFRLGLDSVKGSYFVNHFTSESQTEEAVDFIKRFKKAYKLIPDGLSARGYDAGRALIDALMRSKQPSRESLKNDLSRIKAFKGATGLTSMNKQRDALKPAVILRVDGPVNKLITSIEPDKKIQ